MSTITTTRDQDAAVRLQNRPQRAEAPTPIAGDLAPALALTGDSDAPAPLTPAQRLRDYAELIRFAAAGIAALRPPDRWHDARCDVALLRMLADNADGYAETEEAGR